MAQDYLELVSEASPGKLLRIRTDLRRMEIRLTLRYQRSAPIKATHIKEVLAQLDLKLTADQQQRVDEFLHRFEAEPFALEESLIATGLAPVPGKDAEIHWEIDTGETYAQPEDDEAAVDHHQVTRVINVNEGDVLFRLGEVEPGVDGIDLLGSALPASEGEAFPLELGANVAYLDDGRTLTATSAGAVQIKLGTVSVQPLYLVESDVDFSVGNIDFIGSVHVSGNILGGFAVVSGEDLYVDGNIEGALVNVSGNLHVTGGITGHAKGQIEVAGDVTARYINGATLNSKGDVLVHSEIVNSKVQSLSRINVEHGGIIGGEVTALHEIRAAMLGSPMNVKTLITVGLGEQGQERLEELAAEIERLEQQTKKIRAAVSRFLKQPSLLEKLPENKRGAINQLIRQLDEMAKRRVLLQQEQKDLKGPDPSIVVGRCAFPNVFLRIGKDIRQHIGEETKGPLKYRANRRTRRIEKSRR